MKERPTNINNVINYIQYIILHAPGTREDMHNKEQQNYYSHNCGQYLQLELHKNPENVYSSYLHDVCKFSNIQNNIIYNGMYSMM